MFRNAAHWLPPPIDHPNGPYFAHNFDNVGVRVLREAWNVLFTRELTEFSFADIARSIGVTGPSVYRYYRTISDLGAALAALSIYTLTHEMTAAVGDPEHETPSQHRQMALEAARLYLRYAAHRPRHFALALSKQYADPDRFPDVERAHLHLQEVMGSLLTWAIGRPATGAEAHGFWALVHGSAALIASGRPPHTEAVIQLLERYIDTLGGGSA